MLKVKDNESTAADVFKLTFKGVAHSATGALSGGLTVTVARGQAASSTVGGPGASPLAG